MKDQEQKCIWETRVECVYKEFAQRYCLEVIRLLNYDPSKDEPSASCPSIGVSLCIIKYKGSQISRACITL